MLTFLNTRFYWEINGEELVEESDEKYMITEDGPTKRLVVTNVTEEDTGTYRCVAELQYYPIAVRFNVNVIGSTKDQDFYRWTPFRLTTDPQNYTSCRHHVMIPTLINHTPHIILIPQCV